MNAFLTGFPGFIAGRLVEKLAGRDTRFFLLVQSAFIEKAMREIEKIAARVNVPLENFYLLEGDITHENLGLSAEDVKFVQAEATHVFHLAAIYDLAVKKELAFRVNVQGTKNVNVLVKTIQNLQRYNYVSTCYVAGKRTGNILETELFHNAGFRNFYEETKYLAEVEVEELKRELPTVIFRPSVVVGDSDTGETVKYDGIYSLILYLRKFPALLSLFNIGNNIVKLNLVPVDFVVNAISALSTDEAAVGQTLQIADPAPLTTREIFDTIAEHLANRKSAISFPTALVEKSLMLPMTPVLSGLPHVGVPYFFLEQTYDTSCAQKLLVPRSVSCPPFPTYVRTLLEFVKENPQL
ncbi:MAG: SDR family oxidoreductase [Pyrinomonadaceae bacterium]